MSYFFLRIRWDHFLFFDQVKSVNIRKMSRKPPKWEKMAFQSHHSGTVSPTVWWYVNKMFKNLYTWFFTVLTDTEPSCVHSNTMLTASKKFLLTIVSFAPASWSWKLQRWDNIRKFHHRKLKNSKQTGEYDILKESVTQGRQFNNERVILQNIPSSAWQLKILFMILLPKVVTENNYRMPHESASVFFDNKSHWQNVSYKLRLAFTLECFSRVFSVLLRHFSNFLKLGAVKKLLRRGKRTFKSPEGWGGDSNIKWTEVLVGNLKKKRKRWS